MEIIISGVGLGLSVALFIQDRTWAGVALFTATALYTLILGAAARVKEDAGNHNIAECLLLQAKADQGRAELARQAERERFYGTEADVPVAGMEWYTNDNGAGGLAPGVELNRGEEQA